MPLQRAMRWFSEICGVCLGAGLVWNIYETQRAHERIDGLQKANVVQTNNQTVIVESDRMEQVIEKARKLGWKSNVERNATQSESGTDANPDPTVSDRTKPSDSTGASRARAEHDLPGAAAGTGQGNK